MITAGRRVQAGASLIGAFGLAVEEFAMTGESLPAEKDAGAVLAGSTILGERLNMVYAGTLPVRGRGRAVQI